MPIFQAITNSTVPMLDSFDARCLSNIIYSYGLVEYSPDSGGETLFDVFGQAASKILHTFNSHDLSNMLLAFVYVDAKNPSLLQETGRVISGMDLGGFTGQALANVLWSFVAKSGEADPELFQALGDHLVGRSLDDFWPQALSNIVWSYATAEMSHSVLFEKIGDHVAGLDSLDSFKPQALSNTVWAFATVGYTDERLFSAFAPVIASKLDEYSEQGLANIAWAYSVANVPRQELFNQGFIGACASKENTFSEENLSQLHQWQLWQQELKPGMDLPQSTQEKCSMHSSLPAIPNPNFKMTS